MRVLNELVFARTDDEQPVRDQGMSVSSQISNDGNQLTISINGRFDFQVYDAFRNAYTDVKGEPNKISVNLDATDYMDSSALGMLLLLREHAEQQAASVELCNPQPDVRNVLSVANFDKLFSIS